MSAFQRRFIDEMAAVLRAKTPLEGLFIDRMEQNEEIFAKYINDADFRNAVSEHLLKEVYEQIRGENAA